MKIRNGFVSNSSSSSFIVAIAKIVDPVKFDKFKESVDMRGIEGLKFMSINSIADKEEWDVTIKKEQRNNKTVEIISVESFQDSVSMSAEDYKKAEDKRDAVSKAISSLSGNSNTDILVWNYTGGEDDGAFQEVLENGDYTDLDYKIDLDFFDKDVASFYSGLTEENGLACIDKTYGAGRNG